MKKLLTAVMLGLSLTSCAEVANGLRDISQGVFLKKRIGNNSYATGSSFYDSLVNLSQGKNTNSPIKLNTSNEMTFKTLNTNALIQSNEITHDGSMEILEKELKAHNIKLKENQEYKKCESSTHNNGLLVVSTYEFLLNGKKLHIVSSGHLGTGNVPNPIIIARKSPCEILDSMNF